MCVFASALECLRGNGEGISSRLEPLAQGSVSPPWDHDVSWNWVRCLTGWAIQTLLKYIFLLQPSSEICLRIKWNNYLKSVTIPNVFKVIKIFYFVVSVLWYFLFWVKICLIYTQRTVLFFQHYSFQVIPFSLYLWCLVYLIFLSLFCPRAKLSDCVLQGRTHEILDLKITQKGDC